jgi:sporulation protein YpjB
MFVRMKKRRVNLLLFLFVLIMGGLSVLAGCGRLHLNGEDTAAVPDPQRRTQLEELNRTADELYQLATTGAFPGAREKLNRFGELAASISFTGLTGIEGVDALSDAVVEAKRIYNAAGLDPAQAVKAAAKLKLAADTLTHPNQPMWLQYYKVLSEDTKQMDYAISAGKQAAAVSYLSQLKEHYGTIRPAVWISRKPEEAEKLDSLLTFFSKYTAAGSFNQEVLQSGITQWKEALDVLFRKTGDRTAYMPGIQPDRPVLWTLTVGSFIIAVLLYSAWRMFDTERNTVRRPKREDGL